MRVNIEEQKWIRYGEDAHMQVAWERQGRSWEWKLDGSKILASLTTECRGTGSTVCLCVDKSRRTGDGDIGTGSEEGKGHQMAGGRQLSNEGLISVSVHHKSNRTPKVAHNKALLPNLSPCFPHLLYPGNETSWILVNFLVGRNAAFSASSNNFMDDLFKQVLIH